MRKKIQELPLQKYARMQKKIIYVNHVNNLNQINMNDTVNMDNTIKKYEQCEQCEKTSGFFAISGVECRKKYEGHFPPCSLVVFGRWNSAFGFLHWLGCHFIPLELSSS